MSKIHEWHIEIVFFLAFILAIIIEVLDILQILDFLPPQATSLITLILLSLFVGWNIVERRLILDKQTVELGKLVAAVGAASLIDSEEKVYQAAIDLVGKESFGTVRIYAPVGFWKQSEYKSKWLSALAEAIKQKRVREAKFVFGVPYWNEQYQDMKNTLTANFNQIDSVIIRHLPISKDIALFPNIGMIIFDNRWLSVGFGVYQSHTKVDTAWVITNPDIIKKTISWFDFHVWEPNGSRVISGYSYMRGQSLKLEEGFAAIEKENASVLENVETTKDKTDTPKLKSEVVANSG